jgi:malate dehydrogenase (oxaloacetate-decarboxylating)
MHTIWTDLTGEALLNHPILNKGTAFTQEERDELELNGLLPSHISTLEEQLRRRYDNFLHQETPLAKYIFLSSLQNRNETLFYRLVHDHLDEMLPFIYTPTVGDVSIQYSALYREHRGLYLSYPLKDKIDEMVERFPRPQADVVVVTDGERILGLGDLGVGGMAIPVGKLALYTLFGGIHPERTLPVLLDVGTNNPELLHDPLYIGWRHPRISGEAYDAFVDAAVRALKRRYPRMLLQWEDFAKPHAQRLLERYQRDICSFNDDIQGTASVVLAAILAAVKAKKGDLRQERIAILGGGSAGMGIAAHLLTALQETGIGEEEARGHFYIIDREGLLHTRLTSMDPQQTRFARTHAQLESWSVRDPLRISLLEVIRHARPTILIGVSAQAGAFSEEVVRTMAAFSPRPVFLPLSNPNSRCEAHPEQLIRWTEGRAIIATGSPFAPVRYQGQEIPIAQCNNVYIFPGVGLGAIASGAARVTHKMFLRAASVLSDHSPLLAHSSGALFPPFSLLRNVSRTIGAAVAAVAEEEGVCPKRSPEERERLIDEALWFPSYPRVKRADKAFS